jgi:hypothetical protein
MNLVGYTGGNVACKHLFLGEIAYFYTASEDFCCLSGNKQSRQGFGALTAPQRNWTQTLAYQGVGHLQTPYYDGCGCAAHQLASASCISARAEPRHRCACAGMSRTTRSPSTSRRLSSGIHPEAPTLLSEFDAELVL